MQFLYNLTPFAQTDVHQPLFKMETRRVTWGDNALTLLIKSARRIALYAAAAILFWVAILILLPFDSTIPFINALSSRAGSAALICTALGILATIYLDVTCIQTSFDAISSDVISKRWDLIRLTPIQTADFVTSKHASAQLKAWHACITVIGIRASAITFWIIGIATDLDITPVGMIDSEANLMFNASFLFVTASVVFLAEPIWRLRGLTALGLQLSSQRNRHTESLFGAVFAALGEWFAIIIIFVSAFGVAGLLTVSVYAFCGVFSAVVPVIGVYLFYKWLQNRYLFLTIKRLDTMESERDPR